MLYGVVGLIVLILVIIALIDVFQAGKPIEWKLIWTLVILLLPVIGTILYFLIGKKAL